MAATNVRLTRTFDERKTGRAFVIGADRRIREYVSRLGRRRSFGYREPEEDLDIGRLSGRVKARGVCLVQPNRMMPKWYTCRYILAHRKNRCTLCFSSTHVHAEKSNAHVVVLCLAVLYLTTRSIRWGEEAEKEKEKKEEERREARVRVVLPLLPALPFFFLSSFHFHLLYLFCHGPGT